VVVVGAGAAHEIADPYGAVAQAELQAVDVKGARLLEILPAHRVHDVPDAGGPGAALGVVRVVQAGGAARLPRRGVPARRRHAAEPDGEAAVVAGVERAVRAGFHLAVARELRPDSLERAAVFHPPDHLAQRGAALDRRRQRRIAREA